METKTIKNIDKNKWKVVLVKTIDDRVPIYYRIVNLATYEIKHIPAYRIVDEIINKHIEIVNIKCENGIITILNDDDYEGMEDIIHIDEFDDEVDNLLDWAFRHEDGNTMLARFDSRLNAFSPSDYRIDSLEKIVWTCKKGHTIKCGFPSFFARKYSCPICKLEDNGETPSLHYWAHLTDNLDVLSWYDDAVQNLAYSTDIGWKERKKVWFSNGEEEVKAYLSDITNKGKRIGFMEVESINLSK